MNNCPLLIEFVPGTRISHDPAFVEFASTLPILQNGPPGTSVVFEDGARVPLPTDQIVFGEDGDGAAQVGFGGMRFEGTEGGQLIFLRVRDLQPEELLSPQRGRRIRCRTGRSTSLSHAQIFSEPYLGTPFSESPIRDGNPASPNSSHVLRNVNV